MSVKTTHLEIVYATHGGTAIEVSERIQRECRLSSLSASIHSIADFDIECWKKLLKRSHPSVKDLRFSVFGLGDSSYLKYNFPAKKLYKRIIQLGGGAICSIGLGDDQHPQGWLKDVWMNLLEIGVVLHKHDGVPKPSYAIDTFTTVTDKVSDGTDKTSMHHGTVIENTRITSASHFQDVRSIKIRVKEDTKPFWYDAGDILVIKPQNAPSEVQAFISHLGYDAIADTPLTITSTFPNPTTHNNYASTLRQILTHNLDIFGPIKRYTFKLLSHFTTDPTHSQKLLDLSSTEHTDAYLSYAYTPRRTFFEIIQDFPSLVIPVAYLFDLVAGIKVRSFSIASACEVNGDTVEVCAAIVGFKNVMKRKRVGDVERFIVDLVEFTVQKGTMECVDTDTPVIFIGPGTGIAPLRSFLLKRLSKGLHRNYLFCGYRNRNQDFLYGPEFESLQSNGTLTLFSAFSRDQDEKVYVQMVIEKQGEMLWRLIDVEGASVFLSGSAKQMPADVRRAFVGIVERWGGMSNVDAEAYMAKLDASKRYQKECWS